MEKKRKSKIQKWDEVGGAAEVETDEVTADADRAIPEENSDESIRQYYILKKELDEIRYKIKSYDDYIENHYSQAALSYTDYKAQEYELEKLENKLESSEDNLKYTFGIHE